MAMKVKHVKRVVRTIFVNLSCRMLLLKPRLPLESLSSTSSLPTLFLVNIATSRNSLLKALVLLLPMLILSSLPRILLLLFGIFSFSSFMKSIEFHWIPLEFPLNSSLAPWRTTMKLEWRRLLWVWRWWVNLSLLMLLSMPLPRSTMPVLSTL